MIKLFCISILVLLFSVLLQGSEKKLPNIILFVSDDHGADDAGCFGNPNLKTPVLDNLAKEGMIFSNAFSPASVCAPSRSALFTGLYPHRNGCHQNHGSVKPGIETLPYYLNTLGYEVVLAGKRHIKPESSFEFKYIDRVDIPDFLRTINNTPFCLVISFNAPHQPYFNHKEGYKNVESKPWLPDTRETGLYTAAYYDHVNILDNELGACLFWIEKYGFADAVQIYTSDHGPAFPFAKWSLYNQGIKVPLIIKWKNNIEEGTQTSTMVSLIDLLPTLVELAGGTIPHDIDGKSLIPLMNQQKENIHDFLFAAYTNTGVAGANEFPIRAVFNSKYKLIVNIKHQNKFHIKRMDEHDERAVIDSYAVLNSWLEKGAGTEAHKRALAHWNRPAIEFYDLEKDPYELNNIADNAHIEMHRNQLLTVLVEWMQKQNDPLTAEVTEISNKTLSK